MSSSHGGLPRRLSARGWRWVAVGSSAAAIVVGAVVPTARALDAPPAPGLPSFVLGNTRQLFSPPISRHDVIERNQNGTLASSFASGQSDAARARLGIRLPTSLTAVNLVSNTVYVPLFTPRGRFDKIVAGTNSFLAQLYLQSPHGVSPAYGVLPPVRVSTLAFGIMPVSATLSLAQLRSRPTAADPTGVPLPITANIYEEVDVLGDGSHHLYDTTVGGDLVLSLHDVTVDGHPVDIGRTCTTTRPVRMSLVGKYSNDYPVPKGSYNPTQGGDLYGRLLVPAFTGCRSSSGDDLSPLFTNVLSGDETSLHLFQGSIGQNQLGCVTSTVGDSTPCIQADPQPVPTGPGQVPDHPRDWTPDPPPPPLPLLPPS